MKINRRLLLQTALLAGLAFVAGMPAHAADVPDSGIYCLEKDPEENYELAAFTHLAPKDGALVFAMNVFGRDANFYAYGSAKPVADNHWRYTNDDPLFADDPAMACIIDIKYDKAASTWNLAVDEKTVCAANKGFRISTFIPRFPATSMVGPVQENIRDGSMKEELPGDNLQMMVNMGDGTCAGLKNPYVPIQ